MCVRARGGLWAADVRASMWLESQLLLQIPAADGRADGDPDDNDRAVSDRIVLVISVRPRPSRRFSHQQGLCFYEDC
jgi:hypothetical protein